MLGFLGSVLGAGSSLLGGLFGSNATKDANAANMQMAQENLNFQKDAAQQGLRWKAADATAAETATGINRMALLGAPTFSPSPVSAGIVPDDSMGKGIAGAGQDIQRAINAYADENDRKNELQNKLLEAQIANVNSDTVKNQAAASKQVTQAPTAPTPLFQDFVDDKGRHFRLPSGKASSAMQNWASLPAQIPIAITQAGDAIQSEYHILTDPIRSWFKTHGNSPIRGDVGRYYSTPDVRGLGY